MEMIQKEGNLTDERKKSSPGSDKYFKTSHPLTKTLKKDIKAIQDLESALKLASL